MSYLFGFTTALFFGDFLLVLYLRYGDFTGKEELKTYLSIYAAFIFFLTLALLFISFSI